MLGKNLHNIQEAKLGSRSQGQKGHSGVTDATLCATLYQNSGGNIFPKYNMIVFSAMIIESVNLILSL